MTSTLYSCHILIKLESSWQIFEKYSNIKFHKICPEEAEFFHADWHDMTKLTFSSRSFADALKNFRSMNMDGLSVNISATLGYFNVFCWWILIGDFPATQVVVGIVPFGNCGSAGLWRVDDERQLEWVAEIWTKAVGFIGQQGFLYTLRLCLRGKQPAAWGYRSGEYEKWSSEIWRRVVG